MASPPERVQADHSTVDKAPGETATIEFGVQPGNDWYRISTDSVGSATFAANDRTVLQCEPGAATAAQNDLENVGNPTSCDIDRVVDTVTLRVDIDADSPKGSIFVQQYRRTGGVPADIHEAQIDVTSEKPPVAIRSHGTSPLAAIDKDGDEAARISVRVVDSTGAGVDGITLNVVAVRGVLATTDDGGATVCDQSSTSVSTGTTSGACPVTTESVTTGTDTVKGVATVSMFGNGVVGEAFVIHTHAGTGLTRTTDILIHGAPGKIAATADDESVAVGGTFYIEVEVTDRNGNAVLGHGPNEMTTSKRAGPTADSIVVEEVADGIAAPRKVGATTTPLCFQLKPDGSDVGNDFDEPKGTNAKGLCVIQMTAPDASGSAKDATRGVHTITIDGGYKDAPDDDKDRVSVSIEVAGRPAVITTDAPLARRPAQHDRHHRYRHRR